MKEGLKVAGAIVIILTWLAYVAAVLALPVILVVYLVTHL